MLIFQKLQKCENRIALSNYENFAIEHVCIIGYWGNKNTEGLPLCGLLCLCVRNV